MTLRDEVKGDALRIMLCDESPLRVIAGPGTGKTYALKARVARFLEEGADPSKILVVTFTRTAARDMEKELVELNIPGINGIAKSTLHSYCFQRLRDSQVFVQTGRIARPLLKFEERFLLEDLDNKELFGNIHDRKRGIKEFEAIWAREQDQEPNWSPAEEKDREFQRSLDKWLRFHDAILVAELVPTMLKYLRNNPNCPERRQFTQVLIDEYQDLNKAEQSLIDLLSERGSLTVVGDEDQSIYEGFRFAHPEGVSEFHVTHPNTVDIPLNECRRCPKRVVQIANELIRTNSYRAGRVLAEKLDNIEGDIHIVQWPDMQSEAEGIADYISAKIQNYDFEAGKTLVLCPRRQFGIAIRKALECRNVKAHSFFHQEILDGDPKTVGEFQAQEAFTLLAMIVNPNDKVALRCWLGFESDSLRSKAYLRLREYCSKSGASLQTALEAMNNGEISIPYTSTIVRRYELLTQRLAELADLPGRDLFDRLFPKGEEWAEPFQGLAETSNFVEIWTPDKILEALRTNIIQPEMPTDVEYVRVMSLHKSKGLNADHVIVTGCIQGLIPGKPGDDLSFEQRERFVEEQRRLFYVAITRPKQTLVLSSILRLERSLAHKMGAFVTGNDPNMGDTISTMFFGELGSKSPTPIPGSEWTY